MSIETTAATPLFTITRANRDWPIYEQTPALLALLNFRKEIMGLTLAEAAERAGETVLDWYEIERGARIPVNGPALQALLAAGGQGSRHPQPGGAIPSGARSVR